MVISCHHNGHFMTDYQCLFKRMLHTPYRFCQCQTVLQHIQILLSNGNWIKKIFSKVTNILSLNQNWDVSSQRYLHSRNLHYGFCSLVIRSPWSLSSHTTKRFPHYYPASFLMSFVSILKTGTLFHFTDHFCLKTCNGY